MGEAGGQWRVFPDERRRDWAMREGAGAVGAGWVTWWELTCRLAATPLLSDDEETFRSSLALEASLGSSDGGLQRASRLGEDFRSVARDFLAQLEEADLSTDAFGEACEALPDPWSRNAKGLARLYATFARFRRAGPLAGRALILHEARQKLERQGLPEWLLSVSSIWMLLTDAPSGLALRLVLALAQACERAHVPLVLQVAASGEAAIDASLDAFFTTVERQAQSLNFVELTRGAGPRAEGPWAELAARHIAVPGLRESVDAPTPLTVLAARSPSDEAERVARRVQLLLKSGVPERAITVGLFETSPVEEERFAEALERRGVRTMRPLAKLGTSPLARRALSLLSLEEEGFPADKVSELLPAPSPNAVCTRILLADAGIRDERWGALDERSAYSTRLEALGRRLDGRRPERARQVRALAERCAALFASVRTLPKEAPWAELLERFQLLVARWTVRVGEPREHTAALNRSLVQALAGLRGAKLATRIVTKRRLHQWLRSLWRITPLPVCDGGVQVLDARTLAGTCVDHLFLVGLEEGSFPSEGVGPTLLSDEAGFLINRALRSNLLRSRVGEARLPLQLARDRLHWVQALGSVTSSLTFSFSRSGWGGEARPPGPWVAALAESVGVGLSSSGNGLALEEVAREAELRVAAAPWLGRRQALATEELGAAVTTVLGQEPWAQEARVLAGIETERLHFFSVSEAPPGRHSGAVAPSAALIEAVHYGRERPLSASVLSRWGNCAFQGWLTGVLKLEPRELPVEDLDPRGRGALLHALLEVLVPRLVGLEEGAPVPEALIDQAIQEVEARAEGSIACHPALWGLAKESAVGWVQRLVQSGAFRPFPGLTPREVELSFGTPSASEQWREVVLPGLPGEEDVYLRGQIDRLDEGGDEVAVVDYKSGFSRSEKQLHDAFLTTEFQLPLYLHAARAAGKRRARRAAWIYARGGEVRELDAVLAHAAQTVDGLLAVDAASRTQARQEAKPNLANAVHGLLAPLRAGQFPIRSRDCRYCGLEAVCRVSDRRAEEL